MSAPLSWAHPLVAEWFTTKFGTLTEPQELGWPHILAERTTLISAPTGSGKTLAAFLACIDRLVRKALAGDLQDRTEVLYVSPLKALGNDIQKNLEIPLGEILQMAGERGFLMPEIRTAVRTGDTLMHERRAMLKRPPHILVTTPESLYILLTAEKSRAILRVVETVIVDEIHAVADDKRGVHLALSLERLEALTYRPPMRIGLSATQKPIEEVAHFLTGNGRPAPVIVDVGHKRRLDLAGEVPASQLGPITTNEMWDEIYARLVELVEQHRSTLVFVNTRRLAERIAHRLGERLGEDNVAAHHGSLSRKLRLNAERKLKEGEVKVLVATASLELGIDIGTVDLVVQISSPRAIAVALQRVGRSGHWRGAIPKGRFFACTRDDLLECASLVRAIRQGDLDRLTIPESPLDILAQQIVASCAAEGGNIPVARAPRPRTPAAISGLEDLKAGLWENDIASASANHITPAALDTRAGLLRHTNEENDPGGWDEDELFALVKRAYPYRNLSREAYHSVLEMLSEGIAARRGRYGAYIHRDRVNRKLRPRRGSRLAAITSGGAIPETALFTVVAGLRKEISDRLRDVFPVGISQSQPPVAETVAWLKEECGLDDAGAEQSVEYVLQGRAVLGDVPTQDTIIAERFFDEGGGMQLIIHAPYGGRINKAWGLALRKRFCRSFNFELQAAATDNGLNIALAEQHSFPLADVFHFLNAETVQPILEQAALASPIFGTRWRWDANRSLALLRFQGGKKVPPQIQRMRSDDLLASVFPDVAACQENIVGDIQIPDHPLVKEVMKDVLTEAMDIDGLRSLLRGIQEGRIRCLAVDTPVPSQFSHEILNANPYAYLDDAPLEERRARAVEMRRILPETVLSEIGKLDPAAIAEVRDDAWPDVRDAEELHDALLTLIALPVSSHESTATSANSLQARLQESLPKWSAYFDQLVSQGRAARADVYGVTYWVAAERASVFAQLFPSARLDAPLPELPSSPLSHEEAQLATVTGWIAHAGPVAASQLANVLGFTKPDVDRALLRLETSGVILRGKFTDSVNDEAEWCERRLLARIHRLTLGQLRKQIESVTPAQFMGWLLRWQHVAPSTQLLGERGLLEALRQLQGFEAPANSWERQILARRVANYDPKDLDQLCLTGAVVWGRLSPHPATLKPIPDGKRRVVPSSVAPITFFVREDAEWMISRREAGDAKKLALSPDASVVLSFLHQRGASFFADIVRGTGKLKAEVETALWELVAAGLLTADGFDNLRALIDPKRRSGHGSGRTARPRHSTGRWSLLFSGEDTDRNTALEAICWMLLRRYGIVFREVLTRESILPKWRDS